MQKKQDYDELNKQIQNVAAITFSKEETQISIPGQGTGSRLTEDRT